MSMVFGVHTGPAGVTADELRSVWRRVEELPFDWISVWDHFYAADGRSTTCFEAVASHMALAMDTSRVRCGSLVYCAAYRHPAVLANAMAAIDQFSGGRCEVGLGAGWDEQEYRAHGIDFPPAGARLDLLEEYAAVVKGLLTGAPFDFEGRFFRMQGAVCDPAPVQSPLPLWIGGGGERRTLRIVARHADGWNVPFIGPGEYARKNEVLDGHCADLGRDPREVARSVNVGLAPDDASLHRQFGAIAEFVRPGVLMGSTAEMVDAIGRYGEAGAGQLNVALRAPYELDALEDLAVAIGQLG
jgi:alkanesulfonate monooxygenase SsuD/methylene tetrahydromethanopterin reductase-like flavin-dependent oxidoreductase (luciferase family)